MAFESMFTMTSLPCACLLLENHKCANYICILSGTQLTGGFLQRTRKVCQWH